MHRRRKLLPGHQEVSVACDRNNDALGMEELRRDGRRHAVAHRAARRRELGRVVPELVEAMGPDGEVAGAVREDRVGRQPLAHRRHDVAHVERARHRSVAEVVEVVGATLTRVFLACGRIERRQRRERPCERLRRSGDRERRRIHAAELVGVGGDVHERLGGIGHSEQRVAGRRDLAQAVADHEQDVGVAHPLREAGIGAERKVPDVRVG